MMHSGRARASLLVVLSAATFAHAFVPLGLVTRRIGALTQLGAADAASSQRLKRELSALPSPMELRRAGAIQLQAKDMSLSVSETPPSEDPLADIEAVAMHNADGMGRGNVSSGLLHVSLRVASYTGGLIVHR
jgi:hypothetical protein